MRKTACAEHPHLNPKKNSVFPTVFLCFCFFIKLAFPAVWHRSSQTSASDLFWRWWCSPGTPRLIGTGAEGLTLPLGNGGTARVHRCLMRMDFIAVWAGTRREACGLCFMPVLPLAYFIHPFKRMKVHLRVMGPSNLQCNMRWDWHFSI